MTYVYDKCERCGCSIESRNLRADVPAKLCWDCEDRLNRLKLDLVYIRNIEK